MGIELRMEIGPKSTKLITIVEYDEAIFKDFIRLNVRVRREKSSWCNSGTIKIQAVGWDAGGGDWQGI